MMRYAVVSIVAASAGIACAVQPAIVPGRWHEVKAHPLPPHQMHEECVRLVPGDRLEYSFEAQAALSFNIHYHEGKAVVQPLTRDNVKQDRGEFRPLVAHDYCLTWEAGAQGTPLDYRVRLTRGGK